MGSLFKPKKFVPPTPITAADPGRTSGRKGGSRKRGARRGTMMTALTADDSKLGG